MYHSAFCFGGGGGGGGDEFADLVLLASTNLSVNLQSGGAPLSFCFSAFLFRFGSWSVRKQTGSGEGGGTHVRQGVHEGSCRGERQVPVTTASDSDIAQPRYQGADVNGFDIAAKHLSPLLGRSG